MSWFNMLAPFAKGFVQGFVNEYTHPSPSCSARYDFKAHMEMLASAQGVEGDNLHDRYATFLFNFRGAEYAVAVNFDGAQLLLTLGSTVRFQPGGVPNDVYRAVRRNTASVPGCQFEVMNLDDCSIFCVKAFVEPRRFMPASFTQRLTELATYMEAVDRVLINHGYGC